MIEGSGVVRFMNKTFSTKPSDVTRKWFVVDATDKTLGRLSAQIASVLRGKHKPTFAPHVDMGDFVVVINAEKVKLTGNKELNKNYYRHTGFFGGLKTTNASQIRAKHPTRLLELAIKGMLPHNVLGRECFRHLKVYAGSSHPHEAQKPETLPER
jgi:large subunit ribosomal protein L13